MIHRELEFQQSLAAMSSRSTPAFWPNECPGVVMKWHGRERIMALHRFEDGDIWLARYDHAAKCWRPLRRATEQEQTSIRNAAAKWLEAQRED
jgi:hypothetical protein